MELSLKKIREAVYWCNKSEEVGASYYRLDRHLAKISTVSYNVKRSILNMTGFFIVGASIWVINIGLINYRSYGRLPQYIFDRMTRQQFLDTFYNDCIDLILEFLPIMLIILLPLSVIYGIYSVKKHLKRTQIRCAKRKKEFKIIIDAKMELMQIIPEKCRYKLAANYIVEVFETGRASTMKEALNLYEEQLYHWNMENKMQKLINKQRRDSNAVWRRMETSVWNS